MDIAGQIVAVSCRRGHHFSKDNQLSIRLVAGHGVEGDGHAGATVKHRSRVRVDATQPNLRQVHLIHAELFDELDAQGFRIAPGALGENVTTRGIDLLSLPRGTLLKLGDEALIEITGLRNPCSQIEAYRPGLLAAVLDRDADGNVVRKTGVMAIVLRGGDVRPGDPIGQTLPPEPHQSLRPV